jgi:hypothetical protein
MNEMCPCDKAIPHYVTRDCVVKLREENAELLRANRLLVAEFEELRNTRENRLAEAQDHIRKLREQNADLFRAIQQQAASHGLFITQTLEPKLIEAEDRIRKLTEERQRLQAVAEAAKEYRRHYCTDWSFDESFDISYDVHKETCALCPLNEALAALDAPKEGV